MLSSRSDSDLAQNNLQPSKVKVLLPNPAVSIVDTAGLRYQDEDHTY